MTIRTIDELKECFRRFGADTLYIKPLSPKQDNDKNQIYLGKGLAGVTNLFPASITVRSGSASTKKRKSKAGQPKLEAKIDLHWITSHGYSYEAPNTRIIDYFQYPEVRMSGFLNGCKSPPDALRRTHQQSYGGRILVLATIAAGRVLGLVLTERDDPIVQRFPDLPELPSAPIFRVLTIAGTIGSTPLQLLRADLHKIFGQWHKPVILKPGAPHPVPFTGSQAPGYTLEALLDISANASKTPDKYGFEIKTYGGSRISLMTPGPDGGYQGSHPFREFMARYGTAAKKGDGSQRFTGIHRCGQTNASTGMTLRLTGYDPEKGEFAADVSTIRVELVHETSGEVVASWSLEKLANSWNAKHASAIYIPSLKKSAACESVQDIFMFGPRALVGQGTDVWKLLRAIGRGAVFYDPAHTIYADGEAKVRPQWRMNTSRLRVALEALYAEVTEITP